MELYFLKTAQENEAYMEEAKVKLKNVRDDYKLTRISHEHSVDTDKIVVKADYCLCELLL